MDEQITPLLIKLGLNDTAVAVYLSALELGSATIFELAKHSGIKRTTVYHAVEELKKNGLATEVKKGHHLIIVPENPAALMNLSDKKIAEVKDDHKKITDVLPELMGIFNLPAHKPHVRFYEGIEGIKKVYEDTLRGDHTAIYAFSDYEKMLTVMDFDYMSAYADRRAAKGISISSISNPGPLTDKAIGLSKKQKREVRPVKGMKFDTEVNIYGNKIASISFVRPYAAVIIEDRAIAQTIRSVWKYVWESLK